MFLPLPAASRAAGDEVGIEVRFLSAAEFYAGIPAALPRQSECYQVLSPDGRRQIDMGWEIWGEGVLARALVEPTFGVENLWQLGEDLPAAVHAYLRAVRFFVDSEKPIEFPPQLAELVRRMAKRSGHLPHELLALPVDHFNLDARLLVPEWFAQEPEAEAPAPEPLYTNDPRLIAHGD